MYGDEDGESSYAYAYGDDGEEEAVLQLIGQVRDRHAEPKGSSPRRYRVELRLDGRVAVRLDDLGTEVRVAVRRNDQTEVHEATDDDLGIFKYASNISSRNGSFASGFALIDLEPGFDVGAFVLGEPLHLFGEVGEEEKEEEGYDDC